jgi:uncharacterized protein (TIGR00297 family)
VLDRLKIRDLAAVAAFWPSLATPKLWIFAALTLVFAVLGRAVRGVTTWGAVAGGLACLAILLGSGLGGFSALLVVFLLTWAATRLGYAHKQRLGTAEARGGRNAAQVFANVGVAALCAVLFLVFRDQRLAVAFGAALAEAAADTVSSEIGQAVGGIPRLVTNWKPVVAGTDGAISVAGTVAGAAAAVLVVLTCALTRVLGWHQFLTCAGAGTFGMIADSLLGATLERRGVLGNNAVNFISTAISALTGFLLS